MHPVLLGPNKKKVVEIMKWEWRNECNEADLQKSKFKNGQEVYKKYKYKKHI